MTAMFTRFSRPFVVLLVFAAICAAQAQARPPNVLFIAVDDLNDWVGCLGGHPQARTPNIDRLARRGVLFAKGYALRADSWHKMIVRHNALPSAVRGYLASVSFADAMVGRVLDALARSPYADNTVICLWSDHGYHLGEKEKYHKSTLWEEATRVPLIVVAPGVSKTGGVSRRPVSLVDIYPTLVELAGLAPNPGLDGESLLPLLRDPDAPRRRPAITTKGRGHHAVRSERWRYIRYRDGSEELYDHESDPMEWRNLAGDPEYDEVKAELAKWIPRGGA